KIEPDETFFVNLSNPTVAGGNDTVNTPLPQGTGTIQNDDLPTITIGNASVAEGNSGTTTLSFPLTLSAPAPANGVTVTYVTANGTATAGSDYVAVTPSTGIASIAPGQTTGTADVMVNGDTTIESDETFTVTISNPNGATLGPVTTATGTI